MPQIDKVGFLNVITVSATFCLIVFFLSYLFMVLPHFSNLRAHFDMSKDVFIKILFFSIDKTICTLFIVIP